MTNKSFYSCASLVTFFFILLFISSQGQNTNSAKPLDSIPKPLRWRQVTPLISKYEGRKVKRILYQPSSDKVYIFLKGSVIETNKEVAVLNGWMADPDQKTDDTGPSQKSPYDNEFVSKSKRPRLPNYSYTFGNLDGVLFDVALFKQQHEIQTSEGITFESATVYFSGSGFYKVIVTNLEGPSLDSIKDLIDLCIPGSVVTFDNVKVKGSTGSLILEGKSYLIIDPEIKIKDFDYQKLVTYPEFPGGDEAIRKYLTKKFEQLKDKPDSVSGQFINLAFIVFPNGQIKSMSRFNGSSSYLEKKGFEILQNGPKWKPGTYRAKEIPMIEVFALQLNAQ